MARGIISVKAGTGSGSMSNGKIIVTDGKVSPGAGITVSTGATINFTDQDVSSCKCGDIVDFTITDTIVNGSTVRSASAIAASSGFKNLTFVYDPTAPADYIVNTNEALFVQLQGAWPGNFTVKGGSLVVITDPSYMPPAGSYTPLSGTLSAATDGSYIVVDKAIDLQADMKTTTDSEISIRNSQIAAKTSVSGSKKSHMIIHNCNVIGTINAIG